MRKIVKNMSFIHHYRSDHRIIDFLESVTSFSGQELRGVQKLQAHQVLVKNAQSKQFALWLGMRVCVLGAALYGTWSRLPVIATVAASVLVKGARRWGLEMLEHSAWFEQRENRIRHESLYKQQEELASELMEKMGKLEEELAHVSSTQGENCNVFMQHQENLQTKYEDVVQRVCGAIGELNVRMQAIEKQGEIYSSRECSVVERAEGQTVSQRTGQRRVRRSSSLFEDAEQAKALQEFMKMAPMFLQILSIRSQQASPNGHQLALVSLKGMVGIVFEFLRQCRPFFDERSSNVWAGARAYLISPRLKGPQKNSHLHLPRETLQVSSPQASSPQESSIGCLGHLELGVISTNTRVFLLDSQGIALRVHELLRTVSVPVFFSFSSEVPFASSVSLMCGVNHVSSQQNSSNSLSRRSEEKTDHEEESRRTIAVEDSLQSSLMSSSISSFAQGRANLSSRLRKVSRRQPTNASKQIIQRQAQRIAALLESQNSLKAQVGVLQDSVRSHEQTIANIHAHYTQTDSRAYRDLIENQAQRISSLVDSEKSLSTQVHILQDSVRSHEQTIEALHAHYQVTEANLKRELLQTIQASRLQLRKRQEEISQLKLQTRELQDLREQYQLVVEARKEDRQLFEQYRQDPSFRNLETIAYYQNEAITFRERIKKIALEADEYRALADDGQVQLQALRKIVKEKITQDKLKSRKIREQSARIEALEAQFRDMQLQNIEYRRRLQEKENPYSTPPQTVPTKRRATPLPLGNSHKGNSHNRQRTSSRGEETIFAWK